MSRKMPGLKCPNFYVCNRPTIDLTFQGTNCDVCRRRRRDNFLWNEQSLQQVERDRQRSRRQALGTHLWIKVISNATKTLLYCFKTVVLFFRAHLEDDSVAQRTVFRTILMYGFHACVRIFGCGGVRDTQCGFKVSSQIYWNCNLPTISFSMTECTSNN